MHMVGGYPENLEKPQNCQNGGALARDNTGKCQVEILDTHPIAGNMNLMKLSGIEMSYT